jgi:flagellar biogenesis protein FliO
MRDSSNIYYVVAGIIIHFVVGFAWLVYKLTKKKKNKEDKESNNLLKLLCFF